MERNRKTTVFVIAALIIAIISLGVAFAAFSSTLNITGTATITSTNWDIHFSDASSGSTTGGTVTPSESGTATSSTATLSGTTFTWGAAFKTPGDKVQYHFYVANKGDYNAKLSGIVAPSITCTSGTPATAETAYCQYITYKVSYDSAGSQLVANNDTLNAGQTKDIYVTATLTDYSATISTPPSSNITTNPITTTLIYTQVGEAVTH